MLKKLIYVAGPFASSPFLNTEKANHVGKIATKFGYAPIVPHNSIISEIWGKDDVFEERENGLQITLTITEAVARTENSLLWVISYDDGTLSEGTQLEVNLWRTIRSDDSIIIKTFNEWLEFKND